MKNIAVIPGDGIGKEVAPVGMRVIEAVTGDQHIKTPDLGGVATTEDVGNAIVAAL